jgi:thiol-disulfide isomerase/thioredoxin
MLTTDDHRSSPSREDRSNDSAVHGSMSWGSRITLIMCALMIALLASCGRSRETTTDQTSAAKEQSASTSASPTATGPNTIAPATSETVLALAHQPGARATLVNVWASWCVPCREEFPDLMRVARKYAPNGLRVVLVSVDFDSADAKKFLDSQKIEFPAYFKTGDDMAFINGMNPKWTGSIPATFLYDSTGRAVAFWEGRADYQRFEQATLSAMNVAAKTP